MMLSIESAAPAASRVQSISGLPATSTIFLRGILLLPPLAGTIATAISVTLSIEP